MKHRNRIGVTDRLHFKIASFVIFTILVIFGSYSAYQFLLYQGKLTSFQRDSTKLLGRALTSSLEISMVNSDLDGIQQSLEEISGDSNIVRIFLLNKKNEVRASSEIGTVGTKKNLSDRGCVACHDSPATFPQKSTTIVSLGGNEVLRVVVPISNKPACYRCHPPSQKLNGLLILDHSLQPIRAEIFSTIKRAAVLAFFSVLTMMFLFRWYIKKQIIHRITYIESLARRVVNNELELDIEIAGNDELSSLARSLDSMKDSLRLSIDKIEGHRNYLASLLNGLTDGILIVNDHNELVFVNKSGAQVFHISEEPVQPANRQEQIFGPGGDFSKIRELIDKVRGEEKTAKEVIEIQSSDEKESYLEIHAARLLLPPRRKPEVVVVIKDITNIIATEKQVYQSEKLATVGRLAAGIAHEINNPMATILTCSEGLLKKAACETEEETEYLRLIRESARRCKLITQKLLDYSSASDLLMESVNLEVVLQEAVSLLRFEASKKNVNVKIEVVDNAPMVSGSKDPLVQVLVNLILNGIQAVDVGGEIKIEMKVVNEWLELHVNDNGEGIPKPHTEQIFEPFYTTKPVGIGTGLGLSVSRGIIQRHSGKLHLAGSRPGHTEFVVSLPI
jgi:signal transduction histidine kinase/HAMP domain-containing protein